MGGCLNWKQKKTPGAFERSGVYDIVGATSNDGQTTSGNMWCEGGDSNPYTCYGVRT